MHTHENRYLNNKYVYIFVILAVFLSIGYYIYDKNYSNKSINVGVYKDKVDEIENDLKILKGQEMVFYKSPTCPCCDGHLDGLRKLGVNVKVVSSDIELQKIKNSYNIPGNMQSCHTIVYKNYFIEGHVPYEAIAKLINEKPDIKGITLPGMPTGVPGMPGPKRGKYDIYALNGDKYFTYFKY